MKKLKLFLAGILLSSFMFSCTSDDLLDDKLSDQESSIKTEINIYATGDDGSSDVDKEKDG